MGANLISDKLRNQQHRKKALNTSYASFNQEIKELKLIHQNLYKYLKQEAPEIPKDSQNELPSL